MNHKVHDTLPDGFAYADRLQIDAFMETGRVPGATKVCLVAGEGDLPRLACRLGPPTSWAAQQRVDYREGWLTSTAGEPNDGTHTIQWGFGWDDASHGRMKWHLAYCPEHHAGPDGCGVSA